MILSESENYIIRNEYETVYLTDKKSGKIISIIADMYGDPEGAAISDDESSCVVYGCGAVVYYIKEPFENYEYGTVSKQWFEIAADGTVWFESIECKEHHRVILLSENDLIYDIDIEKRSVIVEKNN